MKPKIPLLIDGMPAPEVARIGIARGWIAFRAPTRRAEVVKIVDEVEKKDDAELPTFADRAETGEVQL